MPEAKDQVSPLLMDEFFNHEDSRFIDTLRRVHAAPKLAALAERWKRDPRPWARDKMKEYLALPMNVPGHEPLVKRLFKHAWHQGDDELMGLFMIAFDRLVRRVVRNRRDWDPSLRQIVEVEEIKSPRNVIPRLQKTVYHDSKHKIDRERQVRNPATGNMMTYVEAVRLRPDSRIFSYHTRAYLRRRAWRYFRIIGTEQSARYCGAIAGALAQYRDEDAASGLNLLDNWGLMHALFGQHSALQFKASQIDPAEGHGLGELSASPSFEQLWGDKAAFDLVLDLLQAAQSRVVRMWAIEILKRHHWEACGEIPIERVFALLDRNDADIQQFAAEIFNHRSDLGTLPLDTWLRMLKTDNAQALELLCDAMDRHVAMQRVSFEQCIELACARPSPVAAIGLKFLGSQRIDTPERRRALVGLADMKCPALAGKGAAWALAILGAPDLYTEDAILPFFDSIHADARQAAWEWLNAEKCPAAGDPALWTRLVETPYADLRLKLVETLARRKELPGAGPDRLTPLWQAVILNIFRGGRQKRLALAQISAAILDHPEKADEWLPLFAAAIRSMRPTEARPGLAAIVTAVERNPNLAESVRRLLPELDLNPSEVVP